MSRSRQIQRAQKVSDVQQRARRTEQELREAVAAARAAGVSWTDLGKALGVSRQAATERFF